MASERRKILHISYETGVRIHHGMLPESYSILSRNACGSPDPLSKTDFRAVFNISMFVSARCCCSRLRFVWVAREAWVRPLSCPKPKHEKGVAVKTAYMMLSPNHFVCGRPFLGSSVCTSGNIEQWRDREGGESQTNA